MNLQENPISSVRECNELLLTAASHEKLLTFYVFLMSFTCSRGAAVRSGREEEFITFPGSVGVTIVYVLVTTIDIAISINNKSVQS